MVIYRVPNRRRTPARRRRGHAVLLAAAAVAGTGLVLPIAPAAQAAPAPGTVTVGVGGAAPDSATFSGGPISGTADGSGLAKPPSCQSPSCESVAVDLRGPTGQPPKQISLAATITFDAPQGNPDGTTGLDLWLLDAAGNTLGSATSGSSPASVAVSGLDPGRYTLEVSGEGAANNDTYTGVVSATVPSPTAPAPATGLFATGTLPPAPDSGLTGTNEDAEPGLGVDGAGTFWVASDIAPYAADDSRALAALSGTDVWKSADGGQTWSWVAAPFNNASKSAAGAGGEDTDIAVAPEKNPNGYYNIYVASLWVGSTSVAVSQDGGQSWSVTPVNGEPVQDRPWLSADGACVFYLSYHAIAPYDTVVNKYDACSPADQAMGSAVDPTETARFVGNIAPGLSNRFGKQVVDNSPSSPFRHRVYAPMEGCTTPNSNGVPESADFCADKPKIFVGYSDDGTTWHDSDVATVDTGQLVIWPDTVATDSAGNVYVGWFDGEHSFVAVSRDGAKTWGAPVQVNAAPALSSVYPTVAASSPGHVEVAFYGSPRAGDAMDAKTMGVPNAYGAAPWQLFHATSDDFGATWTQTTVTPTIHTGVLCYQGGGCGSYPGDRNLLDDFGVAISPTTHATVITFDNDQPAGVDGKTHTDYAVSVSLPPVTPEFPYPAAAAGGVLALVGLAAGLRRRRRRN